MSYSVMFVCWVMMLLEAKSTPIENEESPSTAILFNPLIPIALSLIKDQISKEEPEAIFILGATDFNLRGHYMWSETLGLTIQLEHSFLRFFTNTAHTGVRIGPRVSPKGKGLMGWTVFPFFIMGRTVLTSGTYALASWSVLGAGAELNYTHRWRSVLLAGGVGVYRTENIGYTTYADSMEGTVAPDVLIGIKPVLTLGVGYAF
jgi:hypothetical protein